jgi:LysM repeat protein
MAQTISRWLSLTILLTIMSATLPAFAEEGQIYTIKKGDTLWGLSQRFIEDPYYWPNVWANNPDITNPHLIFPGQKIRILDGRLEIIPAYPEANQVEPADETVAALPQEEIVMFKSTGSGEGFILTTEDSLGTLVDSVDNRVLLTEDDLVFLKMKNIGNVKVGDTYSLFARSENIQHPVSQKSIGTMMYNLGNLQVTEIKGETVVAKIGTVFREVIRGAEVFEYVPQRKELVLQRAATAHEGYVVASHENKYGQSANDIIFIDLGNENNLASGNLFYISRPRQVSDKILKQAGDLDLPDEVLGAGVIIEVKNKTASALIIKSVNAMFVGDKVTMVTN